MNRENAAGRLQTKTHYTSFPLAPAFKFPETCPRPGRWTPRATAERAGRHDESRRARMQPLSS